MPKLKFIFRIKHSRANDFNKIRNSEKTLKKSKQCSLSFNKHVKRCLFKIKTGNKRLTTLP